MQVAKYYFHRFIEQSIKNRKIEDQQSFFKILKIIKNNFESYQIARKEEVMDFLIKQITSSIEESVLVEDFDDILPEGNIDAKAIDKKIYCIVVNSFRGIRQEQKIYFTDTKDNYYKYNIFYGQNGAGKSTLCEVLEYGLTDKIKEAKERGFGDISSYTGYMEEPIIMFSKEEKLTNKSLDYDRFIFEKNRIEDFGRFKSRKKEEQKNILSSLFGFDELEDFLSRFNEQSISKRLKDVIEKNQKSFFEDKRLNEDLQKTVLSKQEKGQILNGFYKELGFQDIPTDDELQTKQKELKELENKQKLEKDKLEKGKSITYKYNGEFGLLNSKILEIKNIDTKIKESNPQLSNTLMTIFQNVKDNENDIDQTKCPLCETIIQDCKKDPFQNAKDQLQVVSDYLKLKTKKEELIKDMENYYEKSVKSVINGLLVVIQDAFFDKSKYEKLLNLKNNLSSQATLSDYETLLSNYILYENNLTELSTDIETYNKDLEKNKLNLDSQLKGIEVSMKEIESSLNLFGRITQSKADIQDYNKKEIDLTKQIGDNKVLLEKEKLINGIIDSYGEAYLNFTRGLKSYKEFVVEEENKTIEGKAVEYYNVMNSGDEEYMKLQRIVVKKSGIFIQFKESEEEIDPLQRFSEGHLKCLGLSLLFSRAKKFKASFLMFDDVVNAIDTDHRTGLKDLLLHSDFDDIQFIITTHDKSFEEMISNDSGVKGSQINRYFITHKKSSGVLIKPTKSMNYDTIINSALEDGNLKQAMVYGRIWLETTVMNDICYKLSDIVMKNGKLNKPDLGVFINSDGGFGKLIKKKIKENLEDEFQELNTIREYLSQKNIYEIINQENHSLKDGYDEDNNKNTVDINLQIITEIVGKIKRFTELVVKYKTFLNS